MKKTVLTFLASVLCAVTLAAAPATTVLKSPDGNVVVNVAKDGKNGQLTYSVNAGTVSIVSRGVMGMTLDNGKTLGTGVRKMSVKRSSVDKTEKSPLYKRSQVRNRYNAAVIDCNGGDYAVEFRVFNEGVAYRFVTRYKDSITVKSEQVDFHFPADSKSYVVYANGHKRSIEEQKFNSFENLYEVADLSQLKQDRLANTPLIVEAAEGKKVLVTDYDVADYPGLFLLPTAGTDGNIYLKGDFAAYPKREKQGGHNRLQMLVTERENYIARTAGTRAFPWRLMMVSDNDAELLDNDVAYCLASPSRVSDISWIKPGKVAWDWWNDWNLKGVDFKTGVNNDTYKYYIDFAGRNGIEYVILDEGWAVNKKADLMQVVPAIDLKQIIDYATAKNVGIILWAGYWAFDRDMEQVVKHYAAMGVKGFKIDFLDRNDQKMVAFTHRAAALCAKHKMLIDFHGVFPPSGITRTYPNVLNFEGVAGLEQMKWQPKGYDAVTFETIVPFGRMAVGPMDYTQGAMRNSTRSGYAPSNSNPMSQGTRCRQLAEYVIFESPLNMLCDSPTNYEREQECTDFIAKIPVVWDETMVIDAKVGEYIITARRSGTKWYVGGITNWTPRTVTVDLSFVGEGNHRVRLYRDGVNADRNAEDYRCETLPDAAKLEVKMQPGGGFAAVVE